MFALFAYDNYYPQGGWNDWLATYESAASAQASAAAHLADRAHVGAPDYYQIVDLSVGVLVLSGLVVCRSEGANHFLAIQWN